MQQQPDSWGEPGVCTRRAVTVSGTGHPAEAAPIADTAPARLASS
jgi:hypothetical protein